MGKRAPSERQQVKSTRAPGLTVAAGDPPAEARRSAYRAQGWWRRKRRRSPRGRENQWPV